VTRADGARRRTRCICLLTRARHREEQRRHGQAVIALLKGKDFGIALQFTDYR
jgi:hypothetical protein